MVWLPLEGWPASVRRQLRCCRNVQKLVGLFEPADASHLSINVLSKRRDPSEAIINHVLTLVFGVAFVEVEAIVFLVKSYLGERVRK